MSWNEEIKKSLASCGENVFIGHNTIIINPENVHLDDNVRIDPFCLITTSLKVGKYSQIMSHAVLSGGKSSLITLEGGNFIGYGSKLFCASEDYSAKEGLVNDFWFHNKIFKGDITFKKYSGIASDVMVMNGITLPEGCTIGAKSFVYTTQHLIEWSVYIMKDGILTMHKKRTPREPNVKDIWK